MLGLRIRTFVSKYLIIFILLGLVALLAILTEGTFLKPQNLINIVRQVSVIAILGIGLTVVIITGGIDLSVGVGAGALRRGRDELRSAARSDEGDVSRPRPAGHPGRGRRPGSGRVVRCRQRLARRLLPARALHRDPGHADRGARARQHLQRRPPHQPARARLQLVRPGCRPGHPDARSSSSSSWRSARSTS